MIDTGSKEADIDGAYRYMLGRQWGSPPFLVWMMLNPSTADALIDDPTIRRVVTFSRDFGYGGCRVINLFALRSPSPKDLLVSADPVGPHNDEYIRKYVGQTDTVVCAWGAVHNKLKWRVKDILGVLEGGPRLTCLGTTSKGDPRHPLYLSKDSQLKSWPEALT